MKLYDIVEDTKGTLYMVDSVFTGKHDEKQVCCMRLYDKQWFTFYKNDLFMKLDCDEEGIGK